MQLKLEADRKKNQGREKLSKARSTEKIIESPDKIKKKLKTSEEQTQNEKNHYKLDRVYKYYCHLGGRTTADYLTITNFHNFLSDTGSFDKLTIQKLDILFFSDNKSKYSIDFNGFLKVLAEISIKKFNPENKEGVSAKDCTKNFFNTYILPLYDKLFEEGLKPTLQSRKAKKSVLQDVAEVTLTDEVYEIFTEIASHLLEIYFIYFPWETSFVENINFMKAKSGKAFYNFLIDFNLSPQLVSQSKTFLIFQSEAMKEENYSSFISTIFGKTKLKKILADGMNSMGIYFNFGKFLYSICKIADGSPDNLLYNFKTDEKSHYNEFTLDRKILNIYLY